MKIEQLLLQPHGQGIGGMILTVKTCKKSWEVDKVWYHQVLFMDETGEMPADVKIGTYSPLKRQDRVGIIVAEVRDAEYLGKPRKILVVDQYKVQYQTSEEYYAEADKAYAVEMAEVRGKIRHGLCCAFVTGHAQKFSTMPVPTSARTNIINEWVEFIMTGRIE